MSALQAEQKSADKAGAELEEDDEPELVAVETEGQEAPKSGAQNQGDDDDDGDSGDDARLANVDPDDEDEREREAIRARRREEKKAQRERKRQAEQRTKRENAQLMKALEAANQRLAALEGRTIQQEAQQIDQRLAATRAKHAEAERVYQHAISSQDGRLASQAQQAMWDARAEFDQLRGVKQRLQQAPVQRPQAEAAPQVDPAVVDLANDFVARHKWYDPEGSDEESRIVQAIDNKLAEDGFDPSDEEYWVELERRVQKRLPHRFMRQKEAAKTERKSGPPVGSGREYAPASTRKEIYVSPERKQALIEAGKWHDPVKRAQALKAYAKYDRDNPTR